ncbi:MAG: hypothetical protein KY460_07800 [Actinobacteria bacterium]|nr:hypothetical protein [Actinomycetota bacterium]
MTQPLNVPRKLRQIDNDVQSIYEMLSGIAGTQLRHGNRLDELAAQLDRMDARLASHDETLASHSDILASHSEMLTSHSRRLEQIDGKLDTVIDMLGDR